MNISVPFRGPVPKYCTFKAPSVHTNARSTPSLFNKVVHAVNEIKMLYLNLAQNLFSNLPHSLKVHPKKLGHGSGREAKLLFAELIFITCFVFILSPANGPVPHIAELAKPSTCIILNYLQPTVSTSGESLNFIASGFVCFFF